MKGAPNSRLRRHDSASLGLPFGLVKTPFSKPQSLSCSLLGLNQCHLCSWQATWTFLAFHATLWSATFWSSGWFSFSWRLSHSWMAPQRQGPHWLSWYCSSWGWPVNYINQLARTLSTYFEHLSGTMSLFTTLHKSKGLSSKLCFCLSPHSPPYRFAARIERIGSCDIDQNWRMLSGRLSWGCL